jgi:plasmid stabilization system protein ParE
MRLRFTLRATSELAAIGDYIRARNSTAAGRVRAAILKSLQNLTRFPRMGRRQTVPGVRKVVTGRYPHLVYYRVDADAQEVVVLSIRHSSRRRRYRNA